MSDSGVYVWCVVCRADQTRERGRLFPLTRVIDGDLVTLFAQLQPAEQAELMAGWARVTPKLIVEVLDRVAQRLQ